MPLADVMAVLRAREAAGAIKLVQKPRAARRSKEENDGGSGFSAVGSLSGRPSVRQWTWAFDAHARPWSRLTRLERRELTWLLVGLGACILLLVFLKLASEVMEGDTQSIDTKIVRALRKADDPSTPIGPPWIDRRAR